MTLADSGARVLRQPTIGVVVPVYNRARKVVEALDSVRAQQHPPARLVVVDDGSTDGTALAVQEWQQRWGRELETLLIRQPNLGVSAARNAGFAHVASLDYIAFLDSDDVWPDAFLEAATTALDAEAEAVAASADRVFIEPHGATTAKSTRLISHDPISWIFGHSGGISSCTVLRARAVVAVQGFDERLRTGEDADFFVRIALLGRWLHLPIPPVVFCRDMGRTVPGESNLSRCFEDRVEQWASIYEALHRLLSERGAPVPEGLARSVGKWWERAGDAWSERGAVVRARVCFARSLYWNPVSRPVLKSYLKSVVGTLSVRPVRRRPMTLRPLPVSRQEAGLPVGDVRTTLSA